MARERGGPGPNKAHYLHEAGPQGALLVGSPDTVVAKVRATSVALGGIDRITFQMSMAANDHSALLNAIDLVGRKVAPRLAEG